MEMIAETPEVPYYAVIFTSVKNEEDHGSSETAAKLVAKAQKQEGFLGLESARNELGKTVSYWKDLESIEKWKNDIEHISAIELGKEKFYKNFRVRIAKVEVELGKKD